MFFLLKGCVECEKQNKFYLEGTVFGESDIVLKRNRLYSYITKCDCYMLKLERGVFEQMMEEFSEFREEIHQIIAEREHQRVEQQQIAKFKVENKQEVQRVIAKINFDKIKSQKSLRHLSSQSIGQPLARKRQKTFGSLQSRNHINQQSLKASLTHTFGNRDTQRNETLTPVNDINESLFSEESKESPLVNVLTGNIKLSQHLNKIENIKNTMLMSLSKEQGFNKNRVEERLQETKN